MDDDKTLFNSGIAKLKRIDILRQGIHTSRNLKDYPAWFNNLQGIREEISEKLKEDEDKECDKIERNCIQFLGTKWEGVVASYLKKYGIYLARLEHKYGYSMPDAEQAGRALR